MRQYLRRPKTSNERRQNVDGYGRAKRSGKNLPNSWDDLWRTPERNWKRHRKTQYKTVTLYKPTKKDSEKYAKREKQKDDFRMVRCRWLCKCVRCNKIRKKAAQYWQKEKARIEKERLDSWEKFCIMYAEKRHDKRF